MLLREREAGQYWPLPEGEVQADTGWHRIDPSHWAAARTERRRLEFAIQSYLKGRSWGGERGKTRNKPIIGGRKAKADMLMTALLGIFFLSEASVGVRRVSSSDCGASPLCFQTRFCGVAFL